MARGRHVAMHTSEGLRHLSLIAPEHRGEERGQATDPGACDLQQNQGNLGYALSTQPSPQSQLCSS